MYALLSFLLLNITTIVCELSIKRAYISLQGHQPHLAGGSLGLTSEVAKIVHGGGGRVLGITPEALAKVTGNPVGELRVVPNMHQRMATMEVHADAFIALPGGYGTMEELLEVTCWAQLNLHQKPVGILNIDGFNNSFLSFTDEVVKKGFITPEDRCLTISAPVAKELMEKMKKGFNILEDELLVIPNPMAKELIKEMEERFK